MAACRIVKGLGKRTNIDIQVVLVNQQLFLRSVEQCSDFLCTYFMFVVLFSFTICKIYFASVRCLWFMWKNWAPELTLNIAANALSEVLGNSSAWMSLPLVRAGFSHRALSGQTGLWCQDLAVPSAPCTQSVHTWVLSQAMWDWAEGNCHQLKTNAYHPFELLLPFCWAFPCLKFS